jgi:hypothetical protein
MPKLFFWSFLLQSLFIDVPVLLANLYCLLHQFFCHVLATKHQNSTPEPQFVRSLFFVSDFLVCFIAGSVLHLVI